MCAKQNGRGKITAAIIVIVIFFVFYVIELLFLFSSFSVNVASPLKCSNESDTRCLELWRIWTGINIIFWIEGAAAIFITAVLSYHCKEVADAERCLKSVLFLCKALLYINTYMLALIGAQLAIELTVAAIVIAGVLGFIVPIVSTIQQIIDLAINNLQEK